MNKYPLRIYVTLDFEFSPMYFHNGEGTTERDGCVFQGLGKDLQFQHTDSINRDENRTTITLPFSRETKTAFQQETHRERDVTCEIFSVNETGHHVKRLCYRKGRIFAHNVSHDDDNVTLVVKEDVFDSQHVKDKRYKAKVTEVRGRFSREMYETFKMTILGCAVSLIVGVAIDPLVGLATLLLHRDSHRDICLWKRFVYMIIRSVVRRQDQSGLPDNWLTCCYLPDYSTQKCSAIFQHKSKNRA